MDKRPILGVIGGSGFYSIDGAREVGQHTFSTPYGATSAPVRELEIAKHRVLFIPRHGDQHTLLPSEVPYQANIFALKKLGVTHLIAVSAVGIMDEAIKPGDLIFPDQIFDRTKGVRKDTFFGGGAVGHASFADPFCEILRKRVIKAAQECQHTYHSKGTYVCIEGPRFSSRAESEYFRRTLNPQAIGMTAMPEAPLAREASLSYAMIALATDFDCWKQDAEDVSVDAVLAVLRESSRRAYDVLLKIIESFPLSLSSSDVPYAKAGKEAFINPTLPEHLGDSLGLVLS